MGALMVNIGTDAAPQWVPAGDTSGAPVGAMLLWQGETAPGGWLFADGSTFNQTTYPTLFAALGGTTLPYRPDEWLPTAQITTGIATPATGYSVAAQTGYRLPGNMVQVNIVFTRTGSNIALATPDHVNQVVGTLGAGWMPLYAQSASGSGSSGLRSIILEASGNVSVAAGLADSAYTNSNINTNDNIGASATYAIAAPMNPPRHRWIIRAE